MTDAVHRPLRRAVLAAALAAAGLAVAAPPGRAADTSRTLELVTPGGSGAINAAPTLLPGGTGDSAIFLTPDSVFGSPEGVWNAYAATRGTSEWDTTSLTSAFTEPTIANGWGPANDQFANFPVGASADGSRVYLRTTVALDPVHDTNLVSDLYVIDHGKATLLTHDENGNATGLDNVGGADNNEGISMYLQGQLDRAVPSPNLSRVIATIPGNNRLVASASNAPNENGLYTLDAGGTVQYIGDLGNFNSPTGYRSMSDDGSVVAYLQQTSSDDTLWVWHDGMNTQVAQVTSTDSTALNSNARVTSDGRTLFFTTSQQLDPMAPRDEPSTYRYDVATGTATLIAPNATFLTAAEDGSHVFFTSTDVLADGARPGDNNLYLRTANGISLVADFGSDVPAVRPRTTQTASNLNVAITPDGTSAELVTSAPLDPAHDGNGTPDVYLWHEGSGVTLISGGTTGAPATGVSIGTGPSPTAIPTGYGWPGANQDSPTTLADDGSWAFFSSTAALTQDAVGTALKVYAWHDGTLTLVSQAGPDRTNALFMGATASGRDVFFVTSDGLTSDDTDGGHMDLYDARMGGGFTAPPPPPPACPAVGCSPLEPVTPPATTAFSGVGDPKPAAEPSSSFNVRKSGATLTVKVANAGKLALVGTATERVEHGKKTVKKTVTVARATRVVHGNGSTKLTVVLSKAGKQLLARSHKLAVRVTVTFTVTGAPTNTKKYTITFTQKAKKSAAKGGHR